MSNKREENQNLEVDKMENNDQNIDEINNLKNMIEEFKKLKDEVEAGKVALEKERELLANDKEKILKELELQKKELVISPEQKANDLAEAKKTAEILNKEKVKIKIPVDPQNPKDLDVYVQINGYPWIIKRGETVEVPVAVAEILQKAKYI